MSKPNMITEKVYSIPMESREMIQKYAAGRTDIINLAVGNPDIPTPQYVIDKSKEALDQRFTRYTGYYGTEELKTAIAENLKEKTNLEYQGDSEVIVTHGAMEAIFVCIQALIDDGDEIIIPTPHFAPFEQATVFAKGKAVFVELKAEDDFRLDPEILEKAITPKSKAIIFSNPSNPIGVVWSKEDLEQIARIAIKHNLIVISDEIYDGLIDGIYPGSIAGIPGMRERTLILNGFSKTYCMTGFRVGYIVGPEILIAEIKKLHYCVTLCPCSISQKAALAALNCPENEVNDIKETFSRRRKSIYQELMDIPEIKCTKPQGGMFVLPDFKAYGKDGEELSKFFVRETGVITLPVNVQGELGKGLLRLSICAEEDLIVEGIRRIKKALLKLR